MIVEVGDTLNSWLCMYIHGVTLCTHLVSEEDSTEDCEIRRVPRPPPPPPALALAVAAEAAECVMAVAAKSSWLRTLEASDMAAERLSSGTIFALEEWFKLKQK